MSMLQAGKRSFRIAASLLAAGALALSSPGTASAASAHHSASHPHAAHASKTQVISVTMTTAGFTMPSSIHAGYVTFKVGSPDAGSHGLQGLSVRKGHTLAQVIYDYQLGLSDDRMQNAEGARNLVRDAVLVGGVVTNSYAPISVTIPLAAGTYYFFDINEVALPGSPPPRMHKLRVHGAMNHGSLPRFDSVLGMIMTDDMPRFSAPSSFDTDRGILVYNNSDEIHEVVWRPVVAGTTDAFLTQYYADFDAGRPHAPAPWLDTSRGLQAMSPGRYAVLHVTMTDGLYALLCQVPDDKTGIAHSHMGMHQIVTMH
jgi:hypothetical protein